jgi:hypothetical protein
VAAPAPLTGCGEDSVGSFRAVAHFLVTWPARMVSSCPLSSHIRAPPPTTGDRSSGLLGQPLGIGVGVGPIHIDDRAIATSPTPIGGVIPIAASIGNAGIPLIERDGKLTNRKRLGDLHTYLYFSVVAFRLARR